MLLKSVLPYSEGLIYRIKSDGKYSNSLNDKHLKLYSDYCR